MIFLLILPFIPFSSALAGSEPLNRTILNLQSSNSAALVETLAQNPKEIFLRFQPALDSSTKVLQPLLVSGSPSTPIIQLSLKKCVFFYCEAIDLDASISIAIQPPVCNKNYLMIVDLSRSSPRVREVYDGLDIQVCYQERPGGKGILQMDSFANQAKSFSPGIIQREIKKILLMQVKPIVSAISKSLEDMEK